MVTCDFPSICDPHDEAMWTRFICSMNNEAVLKVLFKHKEGDLTFTKEVAAAVEMEEAAKVAKRQSMVWCQIPFIGFEALKRCSPSPGPGLFSEVHIANAFPTRTWSCCGKMDHWLADCPFEDANC